jgi:ribokinase
VVSIFCSKRGRRAGCETAAVKVAVVGHVEWVEFLRVERVPEPGSIVFPREVWAEPGGAGAVAAVQLARLAGDALFLTAVGADELGRRVLHDLRALGVRVEAAVRDEPQRRAFTYVDADGERTITVLSRKLVPHGDDTLPWDELRGYDAVYFTGGDVDALRRAREARLLVATPRELETLRSAGVELDVLVGSATDEGEQYEHGDLDPAPRVVVKTEGRAGGTYESGEGAGRFEAAPLPGDLADTYGAGDSFAAGLTYALARGDDLRPALAFAAAQGAKAMTRRGAQGT